MKSISINNWAEADRPRSKLDRLGASVVSDAELLANLIGSGTGIDTAVYLVKHIL